MVVKAVDSVVEPIADQGVKLAGEGIKLASEGVKRAAEGVKLAGEGVKLAADVAKIAEDRLRKVLRHRRDDPKRDDRPEKPDDKKKG